MTLDIEQIQRDREARLKSACIAIFRIENAERAVSFDDWVSPSRQRWQRYESEAKQILEAAGVPDLEAQILADAERIAELEAALEAAQESIAAFIGVHGYPIDSGAGDVLNQVNAVLRNKESK